MNLFISLYSYSCTVFFNLLITLYSNLMSYFSQFVNSQQLRLILSIDRKFMIQNEGPYFICAHIFPMGILELGSNNYAHLILCYLFTMVTTFIILIGFSPLLRGFSFFFLFIKCQSYFYQIFFTPVIYSCSQNPVSFAHGGMLAVRLICQANF